MTDPTPTAGTPVEDGGDAAATPTTGTPPADGRNADDGINREEALVWKDKAQRFNEVDRERKQLAEENERLRRAQSPAAPSPGADPRQQAFRDTHAWAQGKDGLNPDPVARVALEAAIGNETLRAELAEREALEDIDDPSLRKEVRKHMQDNRRNGRELDVKAALAEVQVSSAEEMRAENARLQEALRTAQRPNGAAPVLQSREVSASALKARTVSQDEWEESRRGLSSLELAKLEEQVGKGEIKIKG
jgi:hypothetical protein